ncbi:hypothetical protein BDZ89DRAFT_259806 [Hymenopellis radicata]|nr:hypothetical protein BDZ89DRAFT_259806 [Hymenopellis radicata]
MSWVEAKCAVLCCHKAHACDVFAPNSPKITLGATLTRATTVLLSDFLAVALTASLVHRVLFMLVVRPLGLSSDLLISRPGRKNAKTFFGFGRNVPATWSACSSMSTLFRCCKK